MKAVTKEKKNNMARTHTHANVSYDVHIQKTSKKPQAPCFKSLMYLLPKMCGYW